mmetsp:Transcript_1239/g.1433  ORF Transcript_1239/g.1433 Transcript_1239/m.1433 type:complete len:305 (-) Transcript_1239:3-917(-)
MSKLPCGINRSLAWFVLRQDVRLSKATPKQFIQCVIDSLATENHEGILIYCLRQAFNMWNQFLKKESQESLSGPFYEAVMKKFMTAPNNSLRNILLDYGISLAKSDDQKASLVTSMKEGKLALAEGEHTLSKKQRYAIIRNIFKDPSVSREDKDAYLEAERKIDFTDQDDLDKERCLGCLPDDASKDALWAKFLDPSSFKSQDMFYYSSFNFLNAKNEEQCFKFADLFFQEVDRIKQETHRDYAQIFFHHLSPLYLGREGDLVKFKALHAKVLAERPDDSHFLNLLSEEIEGLQEVLDMRALDI